MPQNPTLQVKFRYSNSASWESLPIEYTLTQFASLADAIVPIKNHLYDYHPNAIEFRVSEKDSEKGQEFYTFRGEQLAKLGL